MSEVNNLTPIIYGVETELTAAIMDSSNTSCEFTGECHSGAQGYSTLGTPHSTTFNNIGQLRYVEAFEHLGITAESSLGLLSNGGRFYVDVSGGEYCTPEVTSAEEAVHRVFDGDRIMYGVMAYLLEHDDIQSFQLNRRSADHAGNSRGIHYNFPINIGPAQRTEYYWNRDGVEDAHIAVEIAKAVFAGSGGLMYDPVVGRTKYYHSPRLALTRELFHIDPIEDRSLLRNKISHDTPFGRYESICNDATNSPWALRASLVLVNGVLRMIEAGLHQDLPKLQHPIKAARDIGEHGNETELIVLKAGGDEEVSYKPVNLVEDIATQLIVAHDEYGILDAEMQAVAEEIIDVMRLMHKDPESVAPVVEAVQRKMYLDKILSEVINYDSVEMCRRDFAWDLIGGGVAERLREDKGIGWLGFSRGFNVTARKRRMVTPPQNTRAKVRGDVIKNTSHTQTYEVTSWDTIIEKDPYGGTYRYDLKPLDTSLKQAKRTALPLK